MVQPLAWAKTFFRLADGDTLNLLLNSWTILAIAINEEDVGVWRSLVVWAIKAILSHFYANTIPIFSTFFTHLLKRLFKF